MAANSATRKLRGWIDEIQKTPEAIGQMPQVLAPKIKGQLDQAISSGQSVDGKKWAPRKEDGAQAMRGAQKDAAVVAVVGSNPAIKIVLSNGLVYSEYGTGHQQRRSLLEWDNGLPPKLGSAIRMGIVDMGLPFMSRAGGHNKVAAGTPWQAVST